MLEDPPSPSPVLTRREASTAALSAFCGFGLALLRGEAALAQSADANRVQMAFEAVGEGRPIRREALLAYARDVAAAPYQAARADLPKILAQLPLDQYRQIRSLPHGRLWEKDNRGFSLEPLPAGSVFQTPVNVAVVDDGIIHLLQPSQKYFDLSALQALPADTLVPFSGLRLFAPIGPTGEWTETVSFQGASYFRARAKWQGQFGQTARGLALNVGEARGEEFPDFRQFWVERPSVGSTAIVVHALLDSESVAGLYRMAINPGEMTVFDIECTLFPRVDIANVGLAPLSAMYLFGPNDRNGFDDHRAGVHDVDGLQMWNGSGEWLWRPMSNPETLQISAFVDKNPKGFGLMQRDRRFTSFEDQDNRYHQRPSVWIEPLGEWGEGQVQLFEIPSQEEIHRNIVAYWRPKNPLAKGGEFNVNYRLYWCWELAEKPRGAIALSTRIGRAGKNRRRFSVDFTGEELMATPFEAVSYNLSASRGKITAVGGQFIPDTKVLRVNFELDPEGQPLSELRLVLEKDGKPLSETWLYRWTP